MAKRKKYPKLPNGFGSIKYLGKGRRNPYAVHPPTEEFTLDGIPITPKALCYVNDWMVGFAVLTAYKAGTYVQGMELELSDLETDTGANTLVQAILANYNRSKGEIVQDQGETFAEVYSKFYAYKYEQDKSRTYSRSAKDSTRAAFKNCSDLHDVMFKNLRHKDLQEVIDECPLKYASKELIVTLLHQMYEYAAIYELVDKDYSSFLKINTEDDTDHGEPFSEKELEILWKNREDPVVEMLLIMCYSGYRISAYRTLEIDLKDMYFKGGVKNQSSKNRIVPIYSGIQNLVERRHRIAGRMLNETTGCFRVKMKDKLESLGIGEHTPHDCRHTFSMLCEKYKVTENDRKRMLGHSFGNDITNGVYGHRTLDDLRIEIEKIKNCY